MQGGIVHGLNAALWGEIDFTAGQANQQNFNSYRVLRLNEMPDVTVRIVASPAPQRRGEPGVPPIAPALANATPGSPASGCASCRSSRARRWAGCSDAGPRGVVICSARTIVRCRRDRAARIGDRRATRHDARRAARARSDPFLPAVPAGCRRA